jgi:hypothetical protein
VAGLKSVKIKRISADGFEDVYNMEVENHHNYAVAGGFILHNCDALRYYAKTMLPKWRVVNETET